MVKPVERHQQAGIGGEAGGAAPDGGGLDMSSGDMGGDIGGDIGADAGADMPEMDAAVDTVEENPGGDMEAL